MKRNIFSIHLLLIVALFTLASCDQFLEDEPTDRLPADGAYNTLTDLQLNALGPIYRNIGGNGDSQGLQGTARGVWDLNTFSTDEAIIPTRGADWYDGGIWQNLFLHRFGNVDFTGDTWNYLFKEVLACNRALERIDAFAAAHPGEDVTSVRAEARALRAMFLFYAMDLYGRVPLFTSSAPTVQDMKLQNRSMAFRHIVTELQTSEYSLVNERSPRLGEYYGRMTRPVVQFLLAKVLLNAEVYADDDWTDDWTDDGHPDGSAMTWTVDGSEMNTWEAVEHYCTRIEEEGYSLANEFSDNFVTSNDESPELIFTIPMDIYNYSNRFTQQFRSLHYNHASALGLNGENGPCATIEAMRAFGYGTDDADYRLNQTYYVDEVYHEKSFAPVTLDDGSPLVYYPLEVRLDLSNTPHETTAGARMHKYEVDLAAMSDGQLRRNDIVLFRYADVLLMRCEAMLRDGRAGAAADDLLNRVRGRVSMGYRVATLDHVLEERMLELAWEGWRRNDLIRFGQFTRPYTDRPQTDADRHGYTLVFPIPGETLTACGSDQNPGY
ncbi:MAG: RagB/SusD family nutrient uptake outer membrane protein [Muribaculaceae bacterium]|nr:RagB/SusD family nutrient uptake outer membrane protein [Muribaculaceae bacterium]